MRELTKEEINQVSGGASYNQSYNPYNPFTNPNSYMHQYPVVSGALIGGAAGFISGGPPGAAYGAYEGAAVAVALKGASGAIDVVTGYQ